MVLNIVSLVCVLAITFVNTIFGFYSGILNAFCCVVSAAVAFGFSDPLNGWLTKSMGLHPSYAGACSLILPFLITLLVLRVIADQFFRGNVRVPMYVDWGGGAVCGFVIAEICVGTMILGFGRLPFGGEVMGFERYARTSEQVNDVTKFERRTVWLAPDDFTVGLMNLLSAGSLRSTTTMASVYPDYADWVFFAGNTVQHQSLVAPIRDQNGDGFTDGINITTWWEQTTPLEKKDTRYRTKQANEADPEPPFQQQGYTAAAGKRLIGVRLKLNSSSADRDPTGSATHRFRPTQFRLVGDLPGSVDPDPEQYYPRVIRGAAEKLGDNNRIVDPDNNFSIQSGDAQIDLLYEVPENFKPRFVEYRGFSRKPVLTAELAKAPPKTSPKIVSAEAKAEEEKKASAEGASRFVDEAFDRGGSGDRDDLPFEIDAAAVTGSVQTARHDGDLAIVSGRFTNSRSVLNPKEGSERIRKLKPVDGKRLFMVRTKAREAQSLPGKIFNFAGGVTNTYNVLDNQGSENPMVGYCVGVKRGDDTYVSFVYLPEGDGSFRGMLDVQTAGITQSELSQPESFIIMFFTVQPGTKMEKLQNQTGAGFDLGSWEIRGK